MWAAVYVVMFVGSLIVGSCAMRMQFLAATKATSEELLDPMYLLCVIYCAVNILICIWEIILWVHQDQVIHLYNGYKKKLGRGQLPSPLFLFSDVSVSDALSLKFWADVWGTYALLDVSYAQPGSFGYNADVGNGFSTLIPTLLSLVLFSNPLLLTPYAEARVWAFFLAWSHWQAMYGTFVYFFQHQHQQRSKDHGVTWGQFISLVICSNGLWIIGPSACLYALHHIVVRNSLNGLF